MPNENHCARLKAEIICFSPSTFIFKNSGEFSLEEATVWSSHAGQPIGGGEDHNCKGNDSALSTSKKSAGKTGQPPWEDYGGNEDP